MRLTPMLKISLSPIESLDSCECVRAYKDNSEREDFPHYIYHVCTLSQFGTEKCKYPGKLCRVKEEDEMFEQILGDAVDHALERITLDNLKEGEWEELNEDYT